MLEKCLFENPLGRYNQLEQLNNISKYNHQD